MTAQTFILIFGGGVLLVPALVAVAIADAAQGIVEKRAKRDMASYSRTIKRGNAKSRKRD